MVSTHARFVELEDFKDSSAFVIPWFYLVCFPLQAGENMLLYVIKWWVYNAIIWSLMTGSNVYFLDFTDNIYWLYTEKIGNIFCGHFHNRSMKIKIISLPSKVSLQRKSSNILDKRNLSWNRYQTISYQKESTQRVTETHQKAQSYLKASCQIGTIWDQNK